MNNLKCAENATVQDEGNLEVNETRYSREQPHFYFVCGFVFRVSSAASLHKFYLVLHGLLGIQEIFLKYYY